MAPPGIGAILQFPAQGGWEATTLRVLVRPADRQLSRAVLRREAGCAASDGCATSGEALVSWTLADGDDPGEITLVRVRDGVLVRASWTGHPVTLDPLDRDGPVLVEEIVAFADDPNLGLGASTGLSRRAGDMPGWWQP